MSTEEGDPATTEKTWELAQSVIDIFRSDCQQISAHPQTAKLIEPCKRPLHDPPAPAQSTPVRGATHGEPRHDMPRPQSAPNLRRVVAAIPEHTVRPLPRSPPKQKIRGAYESAGQRQEM